MTQTLTTERLKTIAAWRAKYGAGHNVVIPAEEAEAIAMELLANRKAQPVAIVESSDYVTAAQITGDEPRRKAVKELYEGALVIGQHLYTAPPAPAVPDDLIMQVRRLVHALKKSNPDHALVKQVPDYMRRAGYWKMADCLRDGDSCRAAMLAQPVSQGYKLPDGFKLMPTEITDEIAEAIAMEARCCGGIALCIYEAALAAAPEGGNDE
ncbi:hypothetical protein [Serratia liquefaciens]|uniref:hypothetical protein n=1 Tax=Serratia liquefaciens TaxID=614 RepID=UPI003906D01D